MQIDSAGTGGLCENRDAAKALGTAKHHKYILRQASSENAQFRNDGCPKIREVISEKKAG
jgi:hypothetical protein